MTHTFITRIIARLDRATTRLFGTTPVAEGGGGSKPFQVTVDQFMEKLHLQGFRTGIGNWRRDPTIPWKNYQEWHAREGGGTPRDPITGQDIRDNLAVGGNLLLVGAEIVTPDWVLSGSPFSKDRFNISDGFAKINPRARDFGG